MDNITSDRLFFRKLVPDDFESWLSFHEDSSTSKYWSGLPQNPEQACREDFERTFFRYRNNLGGKLALIEKNTGIFIGLCGLLVQQIDDKQELAIAYSLPSKSFTDLVLLAESLISIIHIDNLPSQKVALNNHMKISSKTIYKGNSVYIFRVKI